MRSSPTFSDTRFSLSFFLITPAKNPRTECCCQSVAFMIAAIVVPLGWCSSFSTADCLDVEDAGDFDDADFGATSFDAAVGFGRGATLLLARFAARDGFRAVLDSGFDLLVAIWLSSGSKTASCAATDTTPPKGGAGRRADQIAIRGRGGAAARPHLVGDRPRRSVVRYPSKRRRLRLRCPRLRRLPRLWRYGQHHPDGDEFRSARL